jgi:hypothetical protein
MKRMVCLLCSALFAALLFSCTDQWAGNGSEITNGYCTASAAPADSAMVVAYPSGYFPYPPSAGPETTYTDINGYFSMRLGHAGWNLVIYDRLREYGAFVPLQSGDSAIDTIILMKVGGIYGIVNDTMAGSRFIGILGSPFYKEITGRTDTFSLIKIPSFNYLISMWWVRETSGTEPYRMKPDLISGNNPNLVMVWPDSTTRVIVTP